MPRKKTIKPKQEKVEKPPEVKVKCSPEPGKVPPGRSFSFVAESGPDRNWEVDFNDGPINPFQVASLVEGTRDYVDLSASELEFTLKGSVAGTLKVKRGSFEAVYEVG